MRPVWPPILPIPLFISSVVSAKYADVFCGGVLAGNHISGEVTPPLAAQRRPACDAGGASIGKCAADGLGGCDIEQDAPNCLRRGNGIRDLRRVPDSLQKLFRSVAAKCPVAAFGVRYPAEDG
eukprot:TRINITY_DN13983_c0_g1_i1.p4 TRINITY_DN13983_c0_g1~~TRINITY_DN13983_c0_g1_i1.p4  ORF type:complete len:123 (-),score=23.67 TRINITY_DN13983_c0_g1_i1:91-459(-)